MNIFKIKDMKYIGILLSWLLISLVWCSSCHRSWFDSRWTQAFIVHTPIPYVYPTVFYASSVDSWIQLLINEGVEIVNVTQFPDITGPTYSKYAQWTGCIKYIPSTILDYICFNRSWYIHRYSIPVWHMSMSWSSENMSYNYSIFSKEPSSPYVISWNQVFDSVYLYAWEMTQTDVFIEHIINTGNDSIEDIISWINANLPKDSILMKFQIPFINITGADRMYVVSHSNGDIDHNDDGTYTTYYFSTKHRGYYYRSNFIYDWPGREIPSLVFWRWVQLFKD